MTRKLFAQLIVHELSDEMFIDGLMNNPPEPTAALSADAVTRVHILLQQWRVKIGPRPRLTIERRAAQTEKSA